MATVIIENPDTGETRLLEKVNGKYPPITLPWRVKGTLESVQREKVVTDRRAHTQSMLATYATRLGLPVPQFLDAARWLLDKNCPYCQLGTQVLRRISEIGADRAIELLDRIQKAKANQDTDELVRIRKEIIEIPFHVR